MENIEKQLEAFIEKMMFFQDIPGLGVVVNDDQKILYAKGFGVTNINTKSIVTPHTIFHMASITKLFVGTAIMQLVEEEKIDLYKPISAYMKDFRLKDERYRDIWVIHLLSHTSGLPDCDDYGWDTPKVDDKALERYVHGLEDLHLMGKPGEKFRYSNIAYEILGHLIYVVSGEIFEDYVKDHILKPLGMNHSTLLLREVEKEKLASPHVKDQEKKVRVSPVFPYNREHSPSSTLYANVLDISRWAMANLNKGALQGERILTESLYEDLLKPVVAIGDGQKMGISWFISRHGAYTMVGHEGSDIGFRTSLGLIPEKKLSVCVLANLSGTSTKKIMKGIFDILLGDSSKSFG